MYARVSGSENALVSTSTPPSVRSMYGHVLATLISRLSYLTPIFPTFGKSFSSRRLPFDGLSAICTPPSASSTKAANEPKQIPNILSALRIIYFSTTSIL